MAASINAESPGRAGAVLASGLRAQKTTRALLLAPAMLIIGIFGILPLCIILIYSFLTAGTYGGVVWKFSADAYVQFLFERDIFDESVLIFTTSYLEIFWRSIAQAAIATVACLVIGFPTAYFMATRPPSQRNFWLFLITIPFWTNLLIRTFAIMLIIRDEGLVNDFLIWLGLIDRPIVILYTDVAIALGLLYSFLPFMVLPLYASIDRIDHRLIEAASDLYANPVVGFFKVTWPLSLPGVISGTLLTFIPASGDFINAQLLGSPNQRMVGNVIQDLFTDANDYPAAGALSMIMMILIVVMVVFYVRRAGTEDLL